MAQRCVVRGQRAVRARAQGEVAKTGQRRGAHILACRDARARKGEALPIDPVGRERGARGGGLTVVSAPTAQGQASGVDRQRPRHHLRDRVLLGGRQTAGGDGVGARVPWGRTAVVVEHRRSLWHEAGHRIVDAGGAGVVIGVIGGGDIGHGGRERLLPVPQEGPRRILQVPRTAQIPAGKAGRIAHGGCIQTRTDTVVQAVAGTVGRFEPEAGLHRADVAPHQPADIVDARAARHRTRGIGLRDAAAEVVGPHQPADIDVARHRTRGIGLRDAAAGVFPHQPTDKGAVRAARHRTRGIGLRDAAAQDVEPHQPADIGAARAARHRTRGIGLHDAAAQVGPHQPADKHAVRAARHRTRGIGLRDAAAVVDPHQPTDTGAFRHRARHRASGVGLRDAAEVDPHQPADRGAARDRTTNQPQIADAADAAGKPNQPDIIHCRPIDGEPIDHIPRAIQAAGKGRQIRPHRHKAGAAIPAAGAGGGDVIGQLIGSRPQGRGTPHALHAINIRQPIGIKPGASTASGAQKAAARDTEIRGSKARQRRRILHPIAAGQFKPRHRYRARRADIAAGLQREPARRRRHRAIQPNLACRLQGQIAGAGPSERHLQRDIARLRSSATRKPGGNHHIRAAKRCHQRAGIDHAVIRGRGKARTRCLHAVGNRDVIGVQQQRAPGAQWRAQIGPARVVQYTAGGDLSLTAAPTFGTAARADAPREIRAAFRPQHNIAAIAAPGRIGADHAGIIHTHLLGTRQIALALPVSANAHAPTAGGARGIHLGPAQRNPGARDGHIAAAARGAAGIHAAGDIHCPARTAGKADGTGAAGNRIGFDNARHVDGMARR